MKFCFLLRKSAAETVLMLQEAFKEEALSKTQVYEWCSRFKGGEMSRGPAKIWPTFNLPKL